ncbi:MAG: 5'/3'-nucleotidase SurE [Bacteroidota bacterium]
MGQPKILVSNDDGISSRGIQFLVSIIRELGEVVVVAPDSPQSGMGHAITIGEPLRLTESNLFEGVEAYKCSGTPADCVKLGKHFVLKDQPPSLVVSGVNHGSNTSISVLYSGTMSAAVEGAIEGFPSIGFSLCDFSADADFSHTGEYVYNIAKSALEHDFPSGVALNVNFPHKQNETIRGVKICRQAHAKWQEEFDQRYDPYGRRYFWMAGNFVNFDGGEPARGEENNDQWAVDNNYVSVVPCQYDMTAYSAIAAIKNWELD